jgi:hypothetical protein
MTTPNDPKLLSRVITIASGVITEARAAKQAAASQLRLLNRAEDEARIMIRACEDPSAAQLLDRERLVVYCHDATSVRSALTSGRTQLEEQSQTLQTLVAISGVTATGSVVPFVEQARLSPSASGTVSLIASRWLEPDHIQPLMASVQHLLVRTGCDKPYAGDQQSPIAQFVAAWSHYQQATEHTSGPSGPFMAMRQCVDDVLESLARRRRVQRPVPKATDERVLSLLHDLRVAGVSADNACRIATEIKGIKDRLSGGKTASHSREFIGLTLRTASQSLESLLSSIDVEKLRH